MQRSDFEPPEHKGGLEKNDLSMDERHGQTQEGVIDRDIGDAIPGGGTVSQMDIKNDGNESMDKGYGQETTLKPSKNPALND